MHEQRDVMLLIEDSADDELAFLKLLKEFSLNLEVKVLRDGGEALSYFFGEAAEFNPVPRLVLMDMHLPKAHGLEVLKAIKSHERTKSVPVTMMSGTHTELLVGESRRLGAEDCVTKPLNLEGLQNIVARAYYLARFR
jgi:two-component system, response regulator